MKIMSIKKIHKRQKLISNPTAGNWSSAPPPPWINLPRDVMANILRRLGAIKVLRSAQKGGGTWWMVCKEEPSIWRIIDINSDDKDLETTSNLATLCCCVVDRSQGGLIDVSLGDLVTDRLLRYISDRIASCGISVRGLTAAVKKLPELEELHLFSAPSITTQDIETIGICCPMLKSFSFNNRWYRFRCLSRDEDYALAIAENIPKLRNLELSGHAFSNEGLPAILDGCPWLESLDLQQSFIEGLKWDLYTRCL